MFSVDAYRKCTLKTRTCPSFNKVKLNIYVDSSFKFNYFFNIYVDNSFKYKYFFNIYVDSSLKLKYFFNI